LTHLEYIYYTNFFTHLNILMKMVSLISSYCIDVKFSLLIIRNGASSSNCAALCTPSFMGRVQRICRTFSSPLVQAVRAPAFGLHRPRTTHCHGCEQSLANDHSVMPAPPHGTVCRKTCALRQT